MSLKQKQTQWERHCLHRCQWCSLSCSPKFVSERKIILLLSVLLYYSQLSRTAFKICGLYMIRPLYWREWRERLAGCGGVGVWAVSHLWTGLRRSCSQRCSWGRRWTLVSADGEQTHTHTHANNTLTLETLEFTHCLREGTARFEKHFKIKIFPLQGNIFQYYVHFFIFLHK